MFFSWAILLILVPRKSIMISQLAPLPSVLDTNSSLARSESGNPIPYPLTVEPATCPPASLTTPPSTLRAGNYLLKPRSEDAFYNFTEQGACAAIVARTLRYNGMTAHP